jgi:hypothetical protein
MGKISNKALNQLQKRGMTAKFADGSEYDGKTKKGYPKSKPIGYNIDLGDGKGTQLVNKEELPRFLADNPRFASKILGSRGAFNLRLKMWSGKYIGKKFFQKYGVDKKGGLADGTHGKAGDSRSRLSSAMEKLRAKIPGSEKMNDATKSLTDKVNKQTGKAKKGGAVYMGAVAACIAVKIPGYIAATIAAVQLLQVMPYFMNVIGSPGSKAKASGVDTANSITPDDMDAIGSILTSKDKNNKSALDSPVLLSAMGVNREKPKIPESVVPGYAAMNNSIVQGSEAANKAIGPGCNVIMSPAAMWSAFAVSSAVTVAASATIVGGIIKVAADFIISEVISEVIKVATEEAAKHIPELLKNADIEKAEGEQLGDVLGVSALATFSSGAAARNVPVLSMAGTAAYNNILQDQNNKQREMDIASLSPFDISSRYTFMGSIVNNIRMGILANGGYNASSLMSTILGAPATLLSPNAGALGLTENACGYAKEYQLEGESPETTPAINVAGLPCTGITPEQDAMSTEDAIDLMTRNKWICDGDTEDCPEIPEDATIDTLVESGYIKSDTPLSEFIESCSDLSTGDYLFNAAGCITPSQGGSLDPGVNLSQCGGTFGCEKNDDGEDLPADQRTVATADDKALQAISVFLLDFQVLQSINGEDEDVAEGGASSTADATIDMEHLFEDSTSVACAAGTTEVRNDDAYNRGTKIPVKLCSIPNTSNEGAIVNSRASGAVNALIQKMRTDLGYDSIPINSSFRTMADQQAAWDHYGAPQAARPGYSNHQMGLAIDFGEGGCAYSAGISSCPASKIWTWLKEHASEFGYKQLDSEWWHWSPTGG